MTDSPSSRRHLFTNLNWVVSANVISGLVNFIAIAWFARLLGPATMGDYALIVTAVQLIAAFLSAGFDQALIREPGDRYLIAAASVATLGQSILLIVASSIVYLLYFLRAPVEAFQIQGPAGMVLGALVLSLFGNLFASTIAAELNYRFLSMVRLASTLAGVGGGLLLAELDCDVYALAGRDMVAALVLLLFVKARTTMSLQWRTSYFGFSRLLRFASGMWGLNFLERVALRLDYAVVGMLFGKEMLGMYFVIRSLVEGVLGFLIQPVQTVLYAHYCRQQDPLGVGVGPLSRLGLAYWGVCVALSLMSWFAAPWGLNHLLGQEYSPAYPIMPGLVLYAGMVLWYENVKVLAMSRHLHHWMIFARLTQLGVFLLMVYPLVNTLGILGAGMATGVGGGALAAMASILYMIAARERPESTCER